MGTVLSQRALTTEYCCLCIWAGSDDCFQPYDWPACALCATRAQLHFGSFLLLTFFLLETPSPSDSLDSAVAFLRNPGQKVFRNHRNFLHIQTLWRQKKYMHQWECSQPSPKVCSLKPQRILFCFQSLGWSSPVSSVVNPSFPTGQLLAQKTNLWWPLLHTGLQWTVPVFSHALLAQCPSCQVRWVNKSGNGDVEMGIPTSEIDSHAGRDGIACISFCARFFPGEMCFLCFCSYYALQPDLCASWIQLGLHTGWKGRIWGLFIIAYMPMYVWSPTPKYRLQSQSTLKNEINMRMYNFYFSPKLSALSHPVIFYTAFQFASFFLKYFLQLWTN